MIRFYKKVRDFNWKYVLGEIFLIFIGITLAIWFNNFNQNRIDENKKVQYLADLKSDGVLLKLYEGRSTELSMWKV